MTTLHLQRIEISNFRAYGDHFSLSLPGPGVTILTGPDELGPSPFIEAIEWALTGRVRRLAALAQESLDRGRDNGLLARREEGVPIAQYGVSLEFVNGEGESTRIERRAVREQENRERFTEVLSPTPQQLMGLSRAGSRLDEKVGGTQRSLVTARIDRDTHELWMLQSYLDSATKKIRQLTELGSAQAARAQLPDLDSLKDTEADIKARIEQLSSTIKEEHEVVARLEEELLASHALQQLNGEFAQAAEAPQLLNWSRWPALLIDEPLQRQGLSHAAAFIEILRGLVRDRKYQVILSIHDEERADSMRRQMEVAGIECVTCRHRGLGPTGVRDSTV